MLGEALLVEVVSAIIAPLIQNAEQSGAMKVRRFLQLDPEHLAIQQALSEALLEFGTDYPEYTSSFFDELFLKTKAAPLLTRYLKNLNVSNALANDLARAFAAQLTHDASRTRYRQFVPVAKSFLQSFDAALRRKREFAELFQVQSLDRIDKNVERIVDALAGASSLGTILPHMDTDPIVYGPPSDDDRFPLYESPVGRDDEIAWVKKQLRDPQQARIAALYGMPGVGKTTIVAECARAMRIEGEFSDGVAIITCDDLTDPAEILRRILARFDPQHHPPREPSELLPELASQRLAGKNALIVLDHVEPDLDLRDVIWPLRRADVAVMLTSHHKLDGDIAPSHTSRQVRLLAEDFALELFARAHGKQSFQEYSDPEKGAARHIVQRLDRHTLAVKLAGAYAWDHQRPLRRLAQELEDPQRALRLPQGMAERAVERIFRKSEESLSEGARQLFAALATFAAPEFSRQATIAVATSIGIVSPDEAVDQLIRRALLEPLEPQNAESLEGADSERLRLHPLLRALAATLIEQWRPQRRDIAAQGLANHYLAAIAETDFAAMEIDDFNITDSFRQALVRGDDQVAVKLGVRMCHYWRERKVTTEAKQLLADAIDATERVDTAQHDEIAVRNLAKLRLAHARVLTDMGAFLNAVEELESVQSIISQLTDPTIQSEVLYDLGLLSWYQGKIVVALQYAERSVMLARKSPQPHRAVFGLLLLAYLAAISGQQESAGGYIGEATTLAHNAEETRLETAVMFMQTVVGSMEGIHTPHSQEQFVGVLRDFVALATGVNASTIVDLSTSMRGLVSEAELRQDHVGEGLASFLAGLVAAIQDQQTDAVRYIESGQKIAHDAAMYPLEAGMLFIQGAIAEYDGQLDRAEEQYSTSLNLLQQVQIPLLQVYVQGYFGSFLIRHRGNRVDGCQALHDAIVTLESNGMADQVPWFREEAARLGCEE